jgi:hypothetical protein
MSSIYSRPRSKSIASEKLKEAESFVEVIPIEHVNSVKAKIEGSYTVNEPGSYILVFGKCLVFLFVSIVIVCVHIFPSPSNK